MSNEEGPRTFERPFFVETAVRRGDEERKHGRWKTLLGALVIRVKSETTEVNKVSLVSSTQSQVEIKYKNKSINTQQSFQGMADRLHLSDREP